MVLVRAMQINVKTYKTYDHIIIVFVRLVTIFEIVDYLSNFEVIRVHCW